MDRPIQAQPSGRRHLFEWEDQPWLPSSLRNIVTDHLRHVFASEQAVSLRETVVDVLEGPLRRSGATHIVDVCSGGGGPLPAVMEGLERRRKATDCDPHRPLSECDRICTDQRPDEWSHSGA
jgi:hypothetical protein